MTPEFRMPKASPLVALPLFLCLAACQPAVESPEGQQTGTESSISTPVIETPEQRAARLQATFPAQQRPPQEPARIALGEGIYGVNCRACHGQDLRGGDMGGPNLLRSDLVLRDQEGELIGAVVREGRSTPGATPMPPLPLSDEEVKGIAAYIHSIAATARGQGAPPPGTEVPLDIVVGSVTNGEALFGQLCSTCHSANSDLAGIATRIPLPENLQNSWVAGRPWNQPFDANSPRRRVTATITLETGERISGRLGRRDDFFISLTTDSGEYRSFPILKGKPAVTSIEINDPMARHLQLLNELSDDMMHDITAYLVTLK
jgi:cytochrome c oxidase cbb3-type subunit III